MISQPWKTVRDDVSVKLLEDGDEVYIYAQSENRIKKERAMRKRRLKHLIRRLNALRNQTRLTRDGLLMKLGAAKKDAGRAFGLMNITLPDPNQPINAQTFHWCLNRTKHRQVYRREGRYLLRSNLPPDNPARLWEYYIRLTEVEEAFRNLKGDLAIRPIHHQKEHRIEAHIFVAFLAYCLHVTLRHRCKHHATGLTPRSVLEQLKAMQMIDVKIPTVDGRWLKMSRYTQPDKTQQLLLAQLQLVLPPQPPPEITRDQYKKSCGEDL